jgi:DNA-binding MarR family transcriptional regulator
MYVTQFSETQINMTESIEREILMQEMMQQVAHMQKQFLAEGEDEERRWMIERTSDPNLIAFLKESTVIMLHVIDAIGELEPVNGITISKHIGIPRGSVSKITRKLVEQGMLNSELLPDNKKEVLFHLTPLGHHMYILHKQLHLHIERNVQKFLLRYTVEQMRFLVQCMKDTSETSWVQPESVQVEPKAASPAQTLEEATDISEIVTLLHQLDDRNLKKAKDIIQIAFFDK